MTTATSPTAISIWTEGIMKAAAMMLNDGRFPKLLTLNKDTYYTMVTDALRAEALAKLDECKQEWKDAIDANMPDSMLRQVMNVQCNHIAATALRKLENAA